MRDQDPAAADVIVVEAELADGLACPSFIRNPGGISSARRMCQARESETALLFPGRLAIQGEPVTVNNGLGNQSASRIWRRGSCASRTSLPEADGMLAIGPLRK